MSADVKKLFLTIIIKKPSAIIPSIIVNNFFIFYTIRLMINRPKHRIMPVPILLFTSVFGSSFKDSLKIFQSTGVLATSLLPLGSVAKSAAIS
ncbi:hypothetical protein [Chryseobacterium indoltheticum]|uniref:hypothetical protein n=1 Tax=Chryseobacterium indoltheticum TaxID=254 RepID=UPI003F491FEC